MNTFSRNLFVILSTLGTLLITLNLISYSKYGIDFTDESFYLIWMSNPFIYNGSFTQFGFVYHLLYVLLDGNIVHIRQANILITFGLAWGFVYFFISSIALDRNANLIERLSISTGLAASSLIVFDSFLITPSYNSLNLQALLIAATGLLLADKKTNRASITGWLLIGFGGWLVFMAKPSSALALAIAALVYLLLARKFSIRLLTISVVCALASLLASALIIDGSIAAFIRRIQLGLEFGHYLEAGHTLGQILRIDGFKLGSKFKFFILLISSAVFIAIWCLYAEKKKWSVVGLSISIIFFVITAFLALGQIQQPIKLGFYQGLLIFALVYASVIAVLVFGRLNSLKTISAQQWSVAALFIVMPHIYAFGSENNYWRHGSSAAIFWLLGGLVILAPLIRRRDGLVIVFPVVLAAQAITAILLQTGLEDPYRQPQPLRLNLTTLEIGPQKSTLILPHGYAEYISNAVQAAHNADFDSKMPVIDLTGQSPGIVYALDAESIGHAWTLGGYAGSEAFVEAGLGQVSCEKIALAWVLFEQEGPLSIPTDFMLRLGLNFPNEYEKVGAWQTAEGAGGFETRRIQELYKPIHPEYSMNKCESLRGLSK